MKLLVFVLTDRRGRECACVVRGVTDLTSSRRQDYAMARDSQTSLFGFGVSFSS